MKTITEKSLTPVVIALSLAIPLVVALLLFLPGKNPDALGFNVRILPLINACINSTVTILLIAGFLFIKNKNIEWHKRVMLAAFVLSSLFLVSYVVYHYTAPETRYGGVGFMRYLYFFILITHILLATAIVPLSIFTIFRGLTRNYEQHKKIAKWTLPIWLYVSITGVLVYIMISPYYPN
jgi:putative membrane protein